MAITTSGVGEIQWTLQSSVSSMGLSVLDNDGVARSVLNDDQPFKVRVTWQVPFPAISEVLGGSFRLRTFAESVGPGDEKQIGADLVVPVTPGGTSYAAEMIVPAFALPGENTNVSGLYSVIAVLQHINGVATQVCGYAEGPRVQIRTP